MSGHETAARSNILVAAVTRDTERSDTAIALLNEAEELYVSVLCLMELRSVLSKKKQFDRDRIGTIEGRITSRTTVTVPDASDMIDANRLQSEALLYPMDALILLAANAVGATLVSFDRDLVDNGAKHPNEID